ncbi:hypothetical protein JH308_17685 [Xanthomonas campestris pv. campestris]|uniref:O-methyltransferase n=1 Tax=Xanthomonas campestris TaxID=339 RepID=UPI0023793FED|nr:O-methyltransferase [Xanthomonas campestris]WDK49091.1 hypothetical protein JH308_17685 [Xanthomonas campestris pv. campestris]WDK54657.1 hypothetical protein JH267_03455 [Xanthomonas campestris pv. campestris]WDL63490.1 hypothetical protein JH259_03395 [Xanthomonas campestris pv. campestris]WDL67558.1 hypothetical protein JH269_02960 [Xanthomonas campestris pv. campestris]
MNAPVKPRDEGSFNKIDYRVRPAKQIERRMISEALTYLQRLGPMGGYWYAGMGSISFLDFTMVHRALGVSRMLSIEHPDFVDRVTFNAPFSCVEIISGEANSVLPTLDYSTPGIVWLDYDGKIDQSMLEDVALLAGKLQPGSVLLVTLNCESGRSAEQAKTEAKKIVSRISAAKLPAGFNGASIEGKKYASMLRQLFHDAVQERVSLRWRTGVDTHRVDVDQILNFVYSDNAKMCTFGWFVDSQGMRAKCGFEELDFYRSGVESFSIRPPVLTPKEIRHLNNQLPKTREVASPGLSSDELESYIKLYRHFPTYFEVLEA